MKIKYIILTIILLCSTTTILCSIGCMDNSYHAYACNDGKLCKFRRHDHKTLHYVKCACPCNEYIVLARKGKCPGCMHYHKPQVDLTIDKNNIYDYLPKSFNQIIGTTVLGIIVDINENGIIVRFDNGFEGLIPFKQLSWLHNYKNLEDLNADFHIGDQLQTIIISFDKATMQFILNLKLDH